MDCAVVCEFDGGAFEVVAVLEVFAVFALVELLLLAAGLSVVVAVVAAAAAGGGALSEAVSAILLDKKRELFVCKALSLNNEGNEQ